MKVRYIAPIAVGLALGGLVGSASAATISLTGTIRDFTSQHPDMEGVISGLTPGLVSSNLDAEYNPVFIGPNGAGGISSAASFAQWYRDVPGTNISTDYSITLDNTITADPNVYTFTSNSFFPIDGQLFGNEGNSHNYHFTYEIHSEFTYQGGEYFNFTGDDDLWVYINGELAMDLGGVHGAASDSIDLDLLGLSIGETYDFDLFFAERHTTQSNFSIDTSIALYNEVPEPATMLLFGTGLAGLAGIRRRKSK